MNRRFDSSWRVKQRLIELGGWGPIKPKSARAHLVGLKQKMSVMTDEDVLRHWYARELESEVICIVCGLECMEPIRVSHLPEHQQMVWDALHLRYTGAVARHFFLQCTDVIPHNDIDAWAMKLRRLVN